MNMIKIKISNIRELYNHLKSTLQSAQYLFSNHNSMFAVEALYPFSPAIPKTQQSQANEQ